MAGRLVDYMGSGLASALPTAATVHAALTTGAAGFYYATDTSVLYSLNRSGTPAWVVSNRPWYFNPPLNADFTQFYSYDANNLTVNADDADVGLTIFDPTTSVNQKQRIVTKNLVGSGDFEVTAHMTFSDPLSAGISFCGFALYESATAKNLMFGSYFDGSTLRLTCFRLTNLGTFGGVIFDIPNAASSDLHFRIVLTTSTLSFQISRNGKYFVEVGTTALTTPFTTRPDKIGFGVYHGGTGIHPTIIACDRWDQDW